MAGGGWGLADWRTGVSVDQVICLELLFPRLRLCVRVLFGGQSDRRQPTCTLVERMYKLDVVAFVDVVAFTLPSRCKSPHDRMIKLVHTAEKPEGGDKLESVQAWSMSSMRSRKRVQWQEGRYNATTLSSLPPTHVLGLHDVARLLPLPLPRMPIGTHVTHRYLASNKPNISILLSLTFSSYPFSPCLTPSTPSTP